MVLNLLTAAVDVENGADDDDDDFVVVEGVVDSSSESLIELVEIVVLAC